MFGILFGTLCLFLLAGLWRGPRCGRGFHHSPHRGHRRHRRSGRRGAGFGRAAGEMFKRRLDVDEDQEDLVDLAFDDLHKAVGGFTRELKRQKSDLADAFAGEKVDEAGLAALWAQQDEELQRFRREAVSALKQIHAVLDPDQRELATSWLRREGGWA